MSEAECRRLKAKRPRMKTQIQNFPALFSGIHQFAFGFWNVSANQFRSFDPFQNDHFNILKRLCMRFTVRLTTGKFGYLCNKTIIFIAPINNYFVFSFHLVTANFLPSQSLH
jgi:hypothetical protein